MDLPDEVIAIFRKAMAEGTYHNPHFVNGVLSALEEVYGFEDPALDKWGKELWGY